MFIWSFRLCFFVFLHTLDWWLMSTPPTNEWPVYLVAGDQFHLTSWSEMATKLVWFCSGQQHCFCFVPRSTTWVLFCSGINNMTFVLFQCQQHSCPNWQQLVRQGEVAWIFTRQGHINQVSQRPDWRSDLQGNYWTLAQQKFRCCLYISNQRLSLLHQGWYLAVSNEKHIQHRKENRKLLSITDYG